MPRRRRDAGAAIGQVLMWVLFTALLVPAGFAGWAIGHYTHVGGKSSATKTVTVTNTTTVTATTTAAATTAPVTTTTAATTAPATTTAAAAAGDAAAGKQVFAAQGCGSCHTFAAAGASGTIGPNLDKAPTADAKKAGEPLDAFVRESIVKPNAYVPSGFQAGIMPQNFAQSLSSSQLDNLVAFLTQSG